MSIRTKLLSVMIGLLVVSAGLSLVLHLKEVERLGDQFEGAVEEIVSRVVQAHQPDGGLAPLAGQVSLLQVEETLVPDVRFGNLWRIRLERRLRFHTDQDLDPSAPESLSQGEMLPPAASETTLLDDFRSPLDATRRESVPRQLLITGFVLLAGLGSVGLIAGRISRPIKDLTEKMEGVAEGNLSSSRDSESQGDALSGDASDQTALEATEQDEIRKMSAAFEVMVQRLRESRDIERRVAQSERLSAMGNLAAGVAHDIRNPLNTVGLILDHLRDNFAPAKKSDADRYAENIRDVQKELARLEELVRNFLSLAHPDHGERVSTNLGTLVTETARLFGKEAERRGVIVETELAEVDALELNEKQIRGAIANVVVNALNSMDDGGALSLTLRESVDSTRDGDAKKSVELIIADSGCGIPPDQIDKIFLPYFTTREEGTGLGLPVARTAVEANDGRLEISSEPGIGTTVRFVFPLGSRSVNAKEIQSV